MRTDRTSRFHRSGNITAASRRFAPVMGAALLLAVAIAFSPWAFSSDAKEDRTARIWCLDEARAIVRQIPRWRCKGKEVTAAEAKAVKDARVRRIQRRLKRDLNPTIPGKRLVGTGTGFFISHDGHVLTNHHVIAQCAAITITPPGQEEYLAQLRRGDSRRDLALLTTGRSVPLPAPFRANDLISEGEPVTIIGYPEHGKVAIKPIQVEGIVRPDDETAHPYVFSMQAPLRRGNSGGPVLDAMGQVMGIVFAKVDTPSAYAKTGKVIKDVGYGVRLRPVRAFLSGIGIELRQASLPQRLTSAQQFGLAKEFIVQIGCWR